MNVSLVSGEIYGS
ncbi:hypothetical protein F383_39198 [Gossypium arboreum]|uniref:Uncharacterized protein n=1 Tax=Gossypium arboreum TaxID=29729 RepID=A0A0B0MKD9_GOSAR|nr:hypothetical protein F383_39198 [Gossypium arboreum]